MIDTSRKSETFRQAKAEARVRMAEKTLDFLKRGKIPKGNVLEMARAAAVMAAKKTSEIIPFCHPLPLDFIGIEYEITKNEVVIRSEVRAVWKTGVEMEALTAASAAALTVYDMCKPLDKTISIEKIVLLEKKGGKRDHTESYPTPLRVGVLVISDSTYKGERRDQSGEIIRSRLKTLPVEVCEFKIIPDDRDLISQELARLADQEGLDLVLTTGGTGLGPKDVTPESTLEVIDRPVPGISETLRSYGQKRTPYAMLSRGVAGVRGKTLIINLPGSSRGVEESMDALFPAVLHSIRMIRGEGHHEEKE